MGENSKIEWTDHTFNPWIGCTKVSEGCKHCYAETLDKRWGRNNWGPQGSRTLTSDANWKKPLQWNRQAEKEGRRFRVFCASLADVFEDSEKISPAWRFRLGELIMQTPHLDWLLLTKRPENVMRFAPDFWVRLDNTKPLPPNVWIGTTVENQDAANKRLPYMNEIPAYVKFISAEPLIGPVSLEKALWHTLKFHAGGLKNCISWVIVGGESGHGSRPMHPEWARQIMGECKRDGIPFLFKQWGEYVPCFMVEDETAFPQKIVDGCIMNKIGKKVAGRLLDGKEHTNFPSHAMTPEFMEFYQRIKKD